MLQNSVNLASQPGFNAAIDLDQEDLTGDGTIATLIDFSDSDPIYFDHTNSFDVDTGVFTAPVGGFYFFKCIIELDALSPANGNAQVILSTTSQDIVLISLDPKSIASSGQIVLNGTSFCRLQKDDTAKIIFFVDGPMKDIGIIGTVTRFGGILLMLI